MKRRIKFEIKATTVDNKTKNKVFRSLRHCHKFACVVDEHGVNRNIWNSKKDKQRYLDYVYKIGVKRAFENLIQEGHIKVEDIERLYFFPDEHTTATNGRYELEEALRQEFRSGTYNYNYSHFFPPIFPKLVDVKVDYCNSSAPKNRLVRGADFVANKIYYLTVTNQQEKMREINNITITRFP